MRVSFFEFVVGVLACAVWQIIETALRAVISKLRTKKERRSPAKGRRSDSKNGKE